ncbi:MAG: hypothetical protein BWX45_01073 [Deltaproteobacteria bacterium ADurb.Bin002]|nr:MAG: hypothetical protein BWX45_01073 [Deltaproteobacteria bacterium ADurb.Bin002]
MLDGEAGLVDLQPVHQVLQFAGAVLFAGQAVVVAGRPQQLNNHFLRGANGRRVGADHHAGGNGRAAGGDIASRVLHFHDTNPAGAHIGCFGIMTKRGDVNPLTSCRLQNRLPRVRRYFLSVNCHCNLRVHVFFLQFQKINIRISLQLIIITDQQFL